MIKRNGTPSALSKSEQDYNNHEADQIRNFVFKVSDLAYGVFRTASNKAEINILNWSRIDGNLNECWHIIKMIQSMGIKIVCMEQPINFRGAYTKCILAAYLIDSQEGD